MTEQGLVGVFGLFHLYPQFHHLLTGYLEFLLYFFDFLILLAYVAFRVIKNLLEESYLVRCVCPHLFRRFRQNLFS